MSRKYWVISIISVCFLALLATAYVLWLNPSTQIADRLCDFVHNEQKMECMAVLATDTYVRPGAIVDYPPTKDALTKIPLPRSDIFGSGCAVPGATQDSITKGISTPRPISIPQFTYETAGRLEAGAQVTLPQLNSVKIEAGPNWNSVAKVELSVEEAWASNVDENLAANAVASCQVRKSCVEGILAEQYRVIGTTIVAKGLSYKMYDKDGKLISLNAGIAESKFKANIGGRTDVEASTTATLRSTEPRVLAARLMPTRIFSGKQVCQEVVLYSVDGTSKVAIGGAGGVGNIGALQSDSKPIGQQARLAATGGESSECRGDFERTRSQALAEAMVEQVSPTALRFVYTLAAHGGHYATVAGCVAGNPIGKSGHDTGATATADLTGAIFVTMRAVSTPGLKVEYHDMPAAELRVLDWKSEPLTPAKGSTAAGAISGDGVQRFDTRGAGVYRVETTVRLNASVNGNQGDQKAKTGDVVVSLTQ